MRTQPGRSPSAQLVTVSSSTERRTRTRLRHLCDEVLASFRIASDRDLFSEQDRAETRALLSRIVRSS